MVPGVVELRRRREGRLEEAQARAAQPRLGREADALDGGAGGREWAFPPAERGRPSASGHQKWVVLSEGRKVPGGLKTIAFCVGRGVKRSFVNPESTSQP